MTLTEARKSCRYLSGEGMRDTEIIRYERSWRVYATDPISGYRVHYDTAERVFEAMKASLYAREYGAS